MMDMDRFESKRDRCDDRDELDDSPSGQHRDPAAYDDDSGVDGVENSSKHSSRDKDRRKSSRSEDRERDHRGKERERSKKTSSDVPKDIEKGKDKHERSKDRSRDGKVKDSDYEHDKYRDKDRKTKVKEKERDRDRDRDREMDKERGKEKNRDRDREKEKTKEKEREREKHRDREKERGNDTDREREKEKEKSRERERETDQDREEPRERDRVAKKAHDERHDKSKDDKTQVGYEDARDRQVLKQVKVSFHNEDEQNGEGISGGAQSDVLAERILKMKEERLKKTEGVSEVSAWVNRSRKLEREITEKDKAKQWSKIFEEQDNIVEEESKGEEAGHENTYNLAGVKVLHGLEKVIEGGAVVLTLKDQNILAGGDINEDVDMLENVEIGEQKRRDEAYKAAKKKTGIYDDKFNDDPASEKKLLPQYDDSTAEEGVTLDGSGHFSGEAEKKLEELRRRLQGSSTSYHSEDLSSSVKISSDYYTQEEMLKFNKPKKKKSLRKKEKLDLDALEAEAVAAGYGAGDLGSRKDGTRQAVREEQERSAAELRNSAYQLALAKADEASKSLRLEQTQSAKLEEDENMVFADDDEDLVKSLERTRKLALQKQAAKASGPHAVALLASTAASNQPMNDQNPTMGETQENTVVFTEMDEFVWGLQLDEEAHKPESEDVFKDEDEAAGDSDQEMKDEAGGWMEVKDTSKDESPVDEDKEDIVPDETIHEAAVGRGLSGALKLLKERGTLKETVEWGGRNMDKKKSKLVGIVNNNPQSDRFKDIRIERTDEFGRILTPKEAFRQLSHKFHGKGPGKMKQEKRMKQYLEELKLKQMKNTDTPSLSVERMREAQAQLKTPYLVLSGHVKPGQTSDPRSGFATVEKDFPGSLTPMLGDKKVEHFLGIKRKAEPGNSSAPKKPKT
ncbi:hypothetical protein K2173_026330 [Erythroxylum novogranatense]|uniref:SART-1 family protein n=1 Tax=Erythroxylum novogranatense TaxID=1862640 RepID=A0AAV8SNW1_9ROSI|nr:hypothetical protein K2173_026330 [Erythroxylum novogranatense]